MTVSNDLVKLIGFYLLLCHRSFCFCHRQTMLSLDEVIIARSRVKQFGDISKYAVQCQNSTLRT